MNYLDCDKKVVSGLKKLLSQALANYHPKIGPDMTDIEMLRDALRILRPKVVELEIFDAIIQMKKGLTEDAITTLRYIVQACDFADAKALLVYCLFLQGDISWHGLAAELLEGDQSPEFVKLIEVIKEYDAFQKGVLSQGRAAELCHPANGMENDLTNHPAKDSAHDKTEAMNHHHANVQDMAEEAQVAMQPLKMNNPLEERALRV